MSLFNKIYIYLSAIKKYLTSINVQKVRFSAPVDVRFFKTFQLDEVRPEERSYTFS